METIKSLEGLSFDELALAFTNAFADYEVNITKHDLELMLVRRGFDSKLSFGAFDNGKLVAFTFNGIGEFDGIPTAYDTGTGTIKEYRGKGLAGKIFQYSIPYLKEAGIEQYLLEVLQNNESAISVYKKQGFEITREFNCYRETVINLKLDKKENPTIQYANETELCKDLASSFWDFQPSWQNSFDAVFRTQNNYHVMAAYEDSKIVGYCIFEPITKDVTQIAVDSNYRNLGIATSMLKQVIETSKADTIKLLNTDTECQSINYFLKSIGLEPSTQQYEMIRKL